ncbi:MAG: metalloregulator ArsR/SmtB family transcription factor [Dehalococcoidia bacterium]|nr:metalloregulator ArsR/SmtB family transcription factor [Dehalococcoidia bacterium]
MDDRQFKDALYEQFARIGHALSTPKRLEILDLLGQGERSVEVLAREANLSVPNASQHLRVLRSARLVDSRRDGLYVYYKLADSAVWRLWAALRELGQLRLTEIGELVRSIYQDEASVDLVDRQMLWRMAQAGDVTVLDVRPAAEFESGHIPGAASIPLEELERRLSEIPREQPVVAYCRGPYCVLAVQAVELLRSHGFTARRLKDGFPEWQEDGFPVEAVGAG